MEGYIMRPLPERPWILLEVQNNYTCRTVTLKKGDITWVQGEGWDNIECYHLECNRWEHNFPKSIFKELCRGTGIEKTEEVLATMRKHISQRDSASLIDEAKKRYPEGTFVYQLYTDGTTNFKKEIKIAHHSLITIDPLDGEVLYDIQWRLKASGCWALLVISKESPARLEEKLVKTSMSQQDACCSCKYQGNCNKGPHATIHGTSCPATKGQHYPKDGIDSAIDINAMLEEAKKRYPVGCSFYSAKYNTLSHVFHGKVEVYPDGITIDDNYCWTDNKWAEIVFLPEKVELTSFAGRYLKAKKDQPSGSAESKSVKAGDYGLITDTDKYHHRAMFGSCFITIQKNPSFEGTNYELMPEGFVPPTKKAEDVPEYIECINWIGETFKVGTIYTVKEISDIDQNTSPFIHLKHCFKPSTKEAYDAQFAKQSVQHDWKVGDAFRVTQDNPSCSSLTTGITYYVGELETDGVYALDKNGERIAASWVRFKYMRRPYASELNECVPVRSDGKDYSVKDKWYEHEAGFFLKATYTKGNNIYYSQLVSRSTGKYVHDVREITWLDDVRETTWDHVEKKMMIWHKENYDGSAQPLSRDKSHPDFPEIIGEDDAPKVCKTSSAIVLTDTEDEKPLLVTKTKKAILID